MGKSALATSRDKRGKKPLNYKLQHRRLLGWAFKTCKKAHKENMPVAATTGILKT